MRTSRWARLAATVAVGAATAASPPIPVGLARPAAQKAADLFVQSASGTITAGGVVTAVLGTPLAAGDLVVAFVAWDGAGSATVSDPSGDLFAVAIGPTAVRGGSRQAETFFAANVAGGATAVTVTLSQAVASFAGLFVHEYRGLQRAAPLDTAIQSSGTTAKVDSGMVRSARPRELLFAGAVTDGSDLFAPTPGYHTRFDTLGALTADQVSATAGPQRFTAMEAGPGWAVQLVAFEARNSAPTPPAYPLKPGPSDRYLVDQRGIPVLLTGDSPQALMVNISEAQADAFFADRQAAGFNAVWINLLCGTYTGGREDDSTYDGIVPFSTPGDLATPNEAYFERVDDMIHLAADHHLTVLLDPAETGSFLSVLLANGVDKARAYGEFLGARYASFDNIIWMSGNDFQSWQDPNDDAVARAVAEGILDTDPNHIHTVELDYLVSGSLDDPTWARIIRLNASYSYYPTYAQVITDYDRRDAPPTFLVEANYEFEHNAGDEGTPQILRRQEYWSLLSGAAGQFYGNYWTWPFREGWEDNLDTPASTQVRSVVTLLGARPWWNLQPDQDHSLVTAGYGTYAETGSLGDNDYLTAARTPDGALAMAYMPTSRTITVDMSKMGAPAYASWYDPSHGVFTAVPGSPLPNAGSRAFTPPGPNGDGDGDWVLVLDAPGVPPDTQPPSIPAGLGATAVADTTVTLGWTASSDNVGVAGYRVYRDSVEVGTERDTAFTDTGLEPRTAYSYQVASFDFAGNASALSPAVPIITTAPAPAFVQGAFATPQSPSAAVAATYAEAQIAGDANVVAVGWNDTAAFITSVSDAAGNRYRRVGGVVRGQGLSQAVYVATNIAASAAGTGTVSVGFDRPAAFVDLRITEYSGLRNSRPFDDAASATGVGSNASTPDLQASEANELLFAAGMTGAVFTGAGPGYTVRMITSPDGDVVEDAIGTAAGAYDAEAPISGGTWLLELIALRPAPG